MIISKLSAKIIATSVITITSAPIIYFQLQKNANANKTNYSFDQQQNNDVNNFYVKEFFSNYLTQNNNYKTVDTQISEDKTNNTNITLNKESLEQDDNYGFYSLFSYSVDDSQIQNSELKNKQDIHLLISSVLTFNPQNETYELINESIKENEIIFDQLITADTFINNQDLFLKTATISIPSINQSKDIYLKIKRVDKESKTLFNFLVKKEGNEFLNTQSLFRNMEYKTKFQFLYLNDSSSNNSGKSENAKIVPETSQDISSLIFNKTDNIERNWLFPTFTSNGFLKNKTTDDDAKYYFLKGLDDNYGHLLSDPKQITEILSSENKNITNIFSSTLTNPYEIGGMIIDEVTDRQISEQFFNSIRDCKKFDGSEVETVSKIMCQVFIAPPLKTHNSIEFIDPDEEAPTEKPFYKTRAWCLKTEKGKFCPNLKYDVAPQFIKLNPKVAKRMYDLQNSQNVKSIPYFEEYKQYWKMPKIEDTFVQAMLETKDIPLKDFVKEKTQSNSADNEPRFPAFFVRTADFRTYGNLINQQLNDFHLSQSREDVGNYETYKEWNLKSNHSFSIQVNKESWQKHLLNNDSFGENGIPDKKNKELRTGVSFTVPVNLVIQDLATNSTIKTHFNWKTDINIENFKNQNKIQIATVKIPINKIGKTNLGQTYWNSHIKNKTPNQNNILGEILLDFDAQINKDGSLTISWNITIANFINDKSTVCDSRDWDTYSLSNPINRLFYTCPYYEKLPTMMSVSIQKEPSFAPYWYLNNKSTEVQSDFLAYEQLSKRITSEIKTVEGVYKQTKQIADLKAKNSLTKHEEEAFTKETCVAASFWTSGGCTYSYSNFMSYFGIKDKNENQKNDEWTTLEVVDLKDNHIIHLGITYPDEHRAPLIINSKHSLNTTHTLFTNEEIKHVDGGTDTTRNIVGIDGQKYSIQETDKAQLDLIEFEKTTILKIDNQFIKSTDKNKPDWIPFRLSLIYNKDKKFSDLKSPIESLTDYIMKKDLDFTTSQITGIQTNPTIVDWTKDTTISQQINGKKDSFALAGMGFWAWKEEGTEKIKLHFKSKIWGLSYTPKLVTNSTSEDIHGSEGSVGFELLSVGIVPGKKT